MVCLSPVVYTTANEKHIASIKNTLAESTHAEIQLEVLRLSQKIRICVATTGQHERQPITNLSGCTGYDLELCVCERGEHGRGMC